MTKKADRATRSQMRSAEYQYRKRVDMAIFWVTLFLFAGVPLLWYGAIEFGLVHPIQTQEFKSAINTAGLLIILVFINYAVRARRYFEDQESEILPGNTVEDSKS